MTHLDAIRPFRTSDAPTVARLVTESVHGHWTYRPEQFEERDGFTRVRLVAERGGDVVATATFYPFSNDPGTLRVDFAGDAQAYSALYLALLPLVPHDTARLLGVVREDFAPMAFFHAAGFRNAWQSWGAHLDLTTFDGARFATLEERLYLSGYELERLEAGVSDADWTALFALHEDGLRDAPRNPTTTPDRLSLDAFRRTMLREEAAFVARRKGEIVASTRLTPRGAEVESEQTVTARSHRGLGLATVLKARALGWAKEEGFTKAGTGGTVLNVGMLKVNARLGYVTEKMWVTWERVQQHAPSPMAGEGARS